MLPDDSQLKLPKEPMDLPKPQLDLPLPEKELPNGIEEHMIIHHNPTFLHEQQNVQKNHRPANERQFSPPKSQVPYRQEVKTLLSWEGMGRPFRQHTKEYYINACLITLCIEVLLFLFAQYVPMLVVLSMLFVVIALATIPPHTVHYKISTEGIAVDDYFYLWQELYDFYFKHISGEDILHIRTKDEYATDITILLGDMHKEYMQSLLIRYLPYREIVPLTFLEKSGDWLSRTFPLDKLPRTQS